MAPHYCTACIVGPLCTTSSDYLRISSAPRASDNSMCADRLRHVQFLQGKPEMGPPQHHVTAQPSAVRCSGLYGWTALRRVI